jgi:hypothetical protein
MSLDDFEKEIAESKEKSNDFYKLQEGSNKMRILTDFVRVESINRGGKYGGIVGGNNNPTAQDVKDGTVQVKGWAWALIRSTGELKIIQFGKTILGQLVALRANEEYRFTELPMPYDIDVQAKGAGTKEVVYTVVPARQNTDVTIEELDALNKEAPIAQIVKAIIDKQDGNPSRGMAASSASAIPYPAEKINADDIPF